MEKYKSLFTESNEVLTTKIFKILNKELEKREDISVTYTKTDYERAIIFDKGYTTEDGSVSYSFSKELQILTDLYVTKIQLLDVKDDKFISSYSIKINSIKMILKDIDKVII